MSLIEKAAEYIESRDKGDQTFGGAKYQSLDASRRQEIRHELMPWLRGQVSQQNKFIGTVQDDEKILRLSIRSIPNVWPNWEPAVRTISSGPKSNPYTSTGTRNPNRWKT